jgi:hypothetical protein
VGVTSLLNSRRSNALLWMSEMQGHFEWSRRVQAFLYEFQVVRPKALKFGFVQKLLGYPAIEKVQDNGHVP